MIELVQFPRGFGLPNPSPFCMRVETHLKLSALDYELTEEFDPKKSPRGKMPFLRVDGKDVPDSNHIAAFLSEYKGVDLDKGLTDEQRVLRNAITRILCESMYFTAIYTRFQTDDGWEVIAESFRPQLPSLLAGFILKAIRRATVKQLHQQGYGRHSWSQIVEIAKQDIDFATHTLQGDSPYVFGDEPTSVDATVFAFLAQLAWVPIENEIKAHVMGNAKVLAYLERMRVRCFPELMKPLA